MLIMGLLMLVAVLYDASVVVVIADVIVAVLLVSSSSSPTKHKFKTSLITHFKHGHGSVRVFFQRRPMEIPQLGAIHLRGEIRLSQFHSRS